MPELPEVETIARGLRAALTGRRIVSVRLAKTDFIDDPTAIEQQIPGARLVAVRRHGKFLLLDLESYQPSARGFSLLIHLGMTGRLVTCDVRAPISPHTHVFFTLDNGRELRYSDVRRFGRIGLLPHGAQENSLATLGLDPLETSEGQFIELFKNRRARIKGLLLNQHVLRGIGNIYADEGLWRARIHPMRLGAKLTRSELRRLYRAVHAVLSEAIELRGSSIADYVDSDGNLGGFQRRHRVYQRQGRKCFRCGARIRRTVVAGRSSHFCPRCQRAPRVRGPQCKALFR
ncbi:MAG TPA: bifunctional DNA-formamidopyrimidine glycosylase/DNA-(apurinic or apyrimidinic site) lyase [Candidatus Acidoferrales bacterium]|nr:bifunctional DNA-formamidopyrimidine glycosylase/DNA-(apurinic or apyrimidinic site) lyase [Candidatus Acidoferrales bacterium]